jgi:hypothetical protein
MAYHSKYWNCSKFADWLRGSTKPEFFSGPEWAEWKKESYSKYPIRFWLAEVGLDHLQDFLTWPLAKLNSIRYYINNRFVIRSHALTSHPNDCKRGEYNNFGDRILPCLFNELVNFVEIENAWHHVAWDTEASKRYSPPFWAKGKFKISVWRSAEAGVENLKWQSNLVYNEDWGCSPSDPDYGKPTDQAIKAKEILELYHWWKEVYPKRPDPNDAGGWTSYCSAISVGNDNFMTMISDRNEEDRATSNEILKRTTKIEEDYEKEDEEMMIRLIKIRKSLWT